MDTLTAHFDVVLGRQAPARSRTIVDTVLLDWGFDDDEWRDAAILIVSELVTNAVRHGGGEITLELRAAGPEVEVSVADGSSVLPRRREPDETGGRGLAAIEALSAGWQVHNHRGGKRVRVDLLPHPAPAAGR
ncbi:ATP-binding protein [Symbioplanes lichenis]|uniref:ATP-binding protein n=1 Tax=Symbioplanes lichenis TaxID=1629072 RepID=UPI0027396A8D|nr:ATP-binding protein [Actinoplanes lichenis]